MPGMNILTDSAAILPVWSISRTAPLLSSLDSSRRHLSTSSPGTFPSEGLKLGLFTGQLRLQSSNLLLVRKPLELGLARWR